MKAEKRRRIIVISVTLLGIFAVWYTSSKIMGRIRGREITPEEFRELLISEDFESLRGKDRRKALVRLTDDLNHLSLEGRGRIDRDNEVEEWYRGLSREERVFVLRETLPRYIGQLREEFNELTPEKRKQTIDRAVEEIRMSGDEMSGEKREWMEGLLKGPEGKAIVETGLKSFYLDSSYGEKLELSPLISAISDELGKIRRK